MNTAKKHATHGFTQFELTKQILNNLSQFKLKPTTINVLLYLTSCYNPKNQYVFPKQKTIAAVFNCSERSVIRAIQELVKEGLIIVECKCTNRYKFTPRIVGECPQNDKNFYNNKMSHQSDKISSDSDNLSHACIEQKKEQEKEQGVNKVSRFDDKTTLPIKKGGNGNKWGNVYFSTFSQASKSSHIANFYTPEEYAILRKYASKSVSEEKIDAYIAGIRKRGGDKSILAKHREKVFIKKRAEQAVKSGQERIRQYKEMEQTAVAPTEAWRKFGEKLRKGVY